jgi:hypothetical protein
MSNLPVEILATPEAYEMLIDPAESRARDAIERAILTAQGEREKFRGFAAAGCPLGLWASWATQPNERSVILIYKNNGLPMIVPNSRFSAMLKEAIPVSMT